MPRLRQRHGVTTSGTSRLLRAVLLLGVLLGAVPATAAAASAAVATAHLAGCGAVGRGATAGDRCAVHELDARAVSAKTSASLERREPPRAGGAPAACCPTGASRPPHRDGVELARSSALSAPPAVSPGSVGRRGPPAPAGT